MITFIKFLTRSQIASAQQCQPLHVAVCQRDTGAEILPQKRDTARTSCHSSLVALQQLSGREWLGRQHHCEDTATDCDEAD